MRGTLLASCRLIAALVLFGIASVIAIDAAGYKTFVPDGAEGYYETVANTPAWVGSEWLITLPLIALGAWALYRPGQGGKLAALVLLVALFSSNIGFIDGGRAVLSLIVFPLAILFLSGKIAFENQKGRHARTNEP